MPFKKHEERFRSLFSRASDLLTPNLLVYPLSCHHLHSQAELASLIKSHSSSIQSESSTSDPISTLTVPVTNCPIFVRIQPVISNFPWSSSSDSEKKEESSNGSLFFIILLRDLGNGLSHETLSQSLPRNWSEWKKSSLLDMLLCHHFEILTILHVLSYLLCFCSS